MTEIMSQIINAIHANVTSLTMELPLYKMQLLSTLPSNNIINLSTENYWSILLQPQNKKLNIILSSNN